ncbi:hypothetical protein [Sulfurospirillum sp. 1612]|uniref:hypothetical protein n=1 Tax=Sulfurospirillum sp. 1612 TaxID=3094835 RepID=UPI002F94265B
MSNNYHPGPYWTINTDEAAFGVVFVIAIFTLPVLPMVIGGWYVGDHFIGNNFAKWGLAILCFGIGYLILLILKERKGFWYAALFVFIEYLLLDYITMIHNHRSTLVMVDIIKGIIKWGLGNS